MPLIERLLQKDAESPRLEAQPGPLDSNMSLHSSLPESAFLDILSALKPLPEFPQLLETVNEQGQTLLHLAIHLRYRELVRKLIHWGIDPNVRDVNGFAALHVGYLCDDPFVVSFLEAEGATPFVLDELGRSPTQLAASFSSATGVTVAGKDEGMVPLAVGYINRLKGHERCRKPDRAIPAETQKTAFGQAVEKDPPSEYVTLCHTHQNGLHYGNPGMLQSNSRVLATKMFSNTQVINDYCQGNRSTGGPHHKDIQEYECDGHTDSFPKWGCKVVIDGTLKGRAVDCFKKKVAREKACGQAAKALGLLNEDEDEDD